MARHRYPDHSQDHAQPHHRTRRQRAHGEQEPTPQAALGGHYGGGSNDDSRYSYEAVQPQPQPVRHAPARGHQRSRHAVPAQQEVPMTEHYSAYSKQDDSAFGFLLGEQRRQESATSQAHQPTRGRRGRQAEEGHERPGLDRARRQVDEAGRDNVFASLFGGGGGGFGGGNQDIVRSAQQWIGQGETRGNNRGEAIGQMQRYTGGRQGQAWCMDYVTAAALQARPNLFAPSSSVQNVRTQFSRMDALRGAGHTPNPGDIVFFGRGRAREGFGHVGIVESVLPDGTFTSIEGNRGPFPSVVERYTYGPQDRGAYRVTGFGDTSAQQIGRDSRANYNYAELSTPSTPNGGGRHHHSRHRG